MAQLHTLVTRKDEISEEAIAILKDYLAMAERGEILAVAVCGAMPNGGVTHQASSTDQQMVLLGGVTRLLHRMNINADTVTGEI
jgi:hypothetical protein